MEQKISENEMDIPFEDSEIAAIEVNGKMISVARFKGRLFAFAYKCPHASGIMAEGWLDAGGNVVCPVHKYRFNMENGRNTSGEGYKLMCWRVKVRADGVFVEF